VAAIVAGLTLGKPLGLAGAAALAVLLRVAIKPDDYSWSQLVGAGFLAGIGFTMSLFIAGQAFQPGGDIEAVKIAIFAASALSAAVGVAILMLVQRDASAEPEQAPLPPAEPIPPR
jgi:NhaA family Na+:H+ antiporter